MKPERILFQTLFITRYFRYASIVSQLTAAPEQAAGDARSAIEADGSKNTCVKLMATSYFFSTSSSPSGI